MLRILLSSLLILIAAGIAQPQAAQRQKSVEKLKKEQQATKRQIRETTKKLNTNTRETKRQLNRLETLRGDMKRQNEIIDRARFSADSVNRAIGLLNDTIARMDSSLVAMRKAYGRALRQMQTSTNATTTLGFILSSESFEQAYRRMRYLRQFSKWRQSKATQLKDAQAQLNERRERLAGLGREKSEALQHLDLAARKLRNQKTETEQLVASLRKEEGNLRSLLKESEMRRQKLDNEIDRMIRQEQERQERKRREAQAKERERREAEQKKSKASATTPQPGGSAKKPAETTPAKPSAKTPEVREAEADRTLTGSFESNRGRLLFPVAGRYSIVKGFGRQPHPELKHVETDNSGIDIETSRGTSARAIFEGTVSAIFKQPGFNTIVMVRHGEYISIYAGLGSLSVKNGQKVAAGQTLGTILSDPENDNRTILHFEIRKERQKLNPTRWVK